MPNYRFRNKPIEALTREEAIEALTQALDRLAAYDFRENAPPIGFTHFAQGLHQTSPNVGNTGFVQPNFTRGSFRQVE